MSTKSNKDEGLIDLLKSIVVFAVGLFINPIFPILFIIIGLSLPRKTGEERKKRDDQKIILLVFGIISLIVQIILHYFLKRKATQFICKTRPTYPGCS